jgi:hypothetical protein
MGWFRNVLHGSEVNEGDVSALQAKLLFDRLTSWRSSQRAWLSSR